MNQPSPAILAQSAARRLPKLALLLLCVAYILPGFVGRGPWKYEDIAAFGVMRELSLSGAHWLQPQLLGQANGFDALIPYWLGAVFIKGLPFLDPALAARLPFMALLALTFWATWYAVYALACSPRAQPVAFAFGGEPKANDYARTIADASLLALIASLGLMQLSHEITPALAQLAFASVSFYAMAASPYGKKLTLLPALCLVIGLTGLALSGAPTLTMLLAWGGLWVEYVCGRGKQRTLADAPDSLSQPHASVGKVVLIALLTLGLGVLAHQLDLWRWRIQLPGADGGSVWKDWRSLGRLLLWFTWPSWPLALWTLWRWRKQLRSRHVALPLCFATLAIMVTLTTTASDRSLLLGLPPLAALAAFALPTFKRSAASLIDWFTLLFFSSCSLIIWVVWIAMQTGIPQQPAANVAKLAPGFVPSFSYLAFSLAVAATLAWCWLVKWRTAGQRAALWKSLVLPAGGATLCWLLLMTLWLPLLDYARSFAPSSRKIAALVESKACVEIYGLSSSQAAALQYHGRLTLHPVNGQNQCPYLIVSIQAQSSLSTVINLPDWAFQATVSRLIDKRENVLVFKRVGSREKP